jgi:hypothetical protein
VSSANFPPFLSFSPSGVLGTMGAVLSVVLPSYPFTIATNEHNDVIEDIRMSYDGFSLGCFHYAEPFSDTTSMSRIDTIGNIRTTPLSIFERAGTRHPDPTCTHACSVSVRPTLYLLLHFSLSTFNILALWDPIGMASLVTVRCIVTVLLASMLLWSFLMALMLRTD